MNEEAIGLLKQILVELKKLNERAEAATEAQQGRVKEADKLMATALSLLPPHLRPDAGGTE